MSLWVQYIEMLKHLCTMSIINFAVFYMTENAQHALTHCSDIVFSGEGVYSLSLRNANGIIFLTNAWSLTRKFRPF